jgi:hypothetical protein
VITLVLTIVNQEQIKMENSVSQYTKLVEGPGGKLYKAIVTIPSIIPESKPNIPSVNMSELFADTLNQPTKPTNSSKEKKPSKLTKRIAFASVVALAGIYCGSVIAHPLEGLRTPQQYGQTLINVGRLATDTAGITNPETSETNAGETNE